MSIDLYLSTYIYVCMYVYIMYIYKHIFTFTYLSQVNFPAVQQTFSVGKPRLRWSPSYRSKPKPHGNGASASGRIFPWCFRPGGVANAGGFKRVFQVTQKTPLLMQGSLNGTHFLGGEFKLDCKSMVIW